jgi:hypothetical protein
MPTCRWAVGQATPNGIVIAFEGCGIGKLLFPLVSPREARTEMPTNLATLK